MVTTSRSQARDCNLNHDLDNFALCKQGITDLYYVKVMQEKLLQDQIMPNKKTLTSVKLKEKRNISKNLKCCQF